MSGEVAIADIAVARTAYPLKERLLFNNYDSQFQLSVLFSGAARYLNAAIHVTRNHILSRFSAYSA